MVMVLQLCVCVCVCVFAFNSDFVIWLVMASISLKKSQLVALLFVCMSMCDFVCLHSKVSSNLCHKLICFV